jgi:golgi phosphoprotein 3
MLNLYEDFFLLHLHEEKISPLPVYGSGYPYWLSAAILGDLALMSRVTVNEKHRLQLVSEEKTGDALLDDTLGKIQSLEGMKKVNYWLGEFEYKEKKLYQQFQSQLLEKGVLKQEDDDLNWVIPYPAESETHASAKFNLKRRLRTLALAQAEPEAKELALLCLLNACNKMELVFLKDERKLARRQMNELIVTAALREPVFQTIQEISSALSAHIDED